MNIPRTQLSDGNAVPVLGLGTYNMQGEEAISAVKQALRLGYTHVDTAELYGNEEEIGKAISEVDRKTLFITSKVYRNHLSYEDTLQACENTLKRLGTDYLDLYLMHWPDSKLDMMETFHAFKQLIDEGKVKSIGVSNWGIKHFEKYLPLVEEIGVKITTNQVECHPLLNQQKLYDYCMSKGIYITAYCPLVRGELSNNTLLSELGKKYGKTPEQVILQWHIQRDIIAIPKASSEKHQKANLDLFDFILTEEEMQRMLTLQTGYRVVNSERAEFD